MTQTSLLCRMASPTFTSRIFIEGMSNAPCPKYQEASAPLKALFYQADACRLSFYLTHQRPRRLVVGALDMRLSRRPAMLLRRHNQILRPLAQPAPLVLTRRRRHVDLAALPAFVLAVPEDGGDSGGQVQAVPRRNDKETMAVGEQDFGNRAVFGAEDVKGALGMRKLGQGLRGGADLDRHRHGVRRKLVEHALIVDDLDLLVPLHALLARQAISPGRAQRYAPPGEPHLPQPITRRQPHHHADVVRILGIDQRNGRGLPVG